MTPTSIQEMLEAIETLPREDQEQIADVLRGRLIEQRRKEIAENARATLSAFKEGTGCVGSADELMQDALDTP